MLSACIGPSVACQAGHRTARDLLIRFLSQVTGSFVRHAGFLVDPAWEFAIGWNLVYGNLLSIPSEITAICVLFEFWTDLNSAVWIIIFMILTVVVGVAFVRRRFPFPSLLHLATSGSRRHLQHVMRIDHLIVYSLWRG